MKELLKKFPVSANMILASLAFFLWWSVALLLVWFVQDLPTWRVTLEDGWFIVFGDIAGGIFAIGVCIDINSK